MGSVFSKSGSSDIKVLNGANNIENLGHQTEAERLFSIFNMTYQQTHHAVTILESSCFKNPLRHSVIICPSNLQAQTWIKKRGHICRTWRKRYCVLDRKELKYYMKEDSDPPFGKKKRGKIALTGAICIIEKVLRRQVFSVMIYGDHGDNDLLFELNLNPESEAWLRMLIWSIWRATTDTLVQNIRKSTENQGELKQKKLKTCTVWMQNEEEKYNKAVLNLARPRYVRILSCKKDGTYCVRIAALKLWTAYGHLPDLQESVNPDQIGLVMQKLETEADKEKIKENKDFDFDESRSIIIPFEDISDVIMSDGCFETSDVLSWNWLSRHQHCASKKPKIFSIYGGQGYTLDLVACCMEDYGGLLISIQDMKIHHLTIAKLKKEFKIDTDVNSFQSNASVIPAFLKIQT